MVCLVTELSINNVDLLLGNDLAGGQVKCEPIVSIKPISDPAVPKPERGMPNLFPVCAVTRSMAQLTAPPLKETAARVLHAEDDADFHLNELFTSTIPEVFPSVPHHCSAGFRDLQESDDDCKRLADIAVGEDECERESGECFYLKDGVLWRKWRHPHCNKSHVYDVHQLVVPKSCRHHILELCHACPLAGHMGVKKTLERIRFHFFFFFFGPGCGRMWPSIVNKVIPVK